MIDVDEDGVEAAGATGVSVTLFSFFESERDVRINRWGRIYIGYGGVNNSQV